MGPRPRSKERHSGAAAPQRFSSSRSTGGRRGVLLIGDLNVVHKIVKRSEKLIVATLCFGSGISYSQVVWMNGTTHKSGIVSKDALIDFIEKPNVVKTSEATVGVVREQNGSPYLRTYVDGEWNDNLLAMPRY
jgi:hypothetical protein